MTGAIKDSKHEIRNMILVLVGMTSAAAWGFIGVFGGMVKLFSGESQLGILMLVTGLIGWCVPMIVEGIEERKIPDLTPRFLR